MFGLIEQVALDDVILREFAGNSNFCRGIGSFRYQRRTAGDHLFLGIVGVDTHHEVSILGSAVAHHGGTAIHGDAGDGVLRREI